MNEAKNLLERAEKAERMEKLLGEQLLQQRKPLTREEMWALPAMQGWFPQDHYRLERIVRAIERAHKIGETP